VFGEIFAPPRKRRIITRTWKRLDVSLNKLRAQESRQGKRHRKAGPKSASAGQRRALGWRAEAALRIEKQRNLVRSCDLLIDVQKADMSKIRLVVCIEWKMVIMNEGSDGLKGRGTMRRA
jgi:hypothetical protein